MKKPSTKKLIMGGALLAAFVAVPAVALNQNKPKEYQNAELVTVDKPQETEGSNKIINLGEESDIQAPNSQPEGNPQASEPAEPPSPDSPDTPTEEPEPTPTTNPRTITKAFAIQTYGHPTQKCSYDLHDREQYPSSVDVVQPVNETCLKKGEVLPL